MPDPRLAALWLDALQRLVDGAAHELNNALNGVVVNLEVVRLRAQPGADPGRVAPFAEAAIHEAESAATMVGALLALSRPSRGGDDGGGGAVDLLQVARHAVALLAPAAAQRGLAVSLESVDPLPAGGSPLAVRAAVVAALLHGAWPPANGAPAHPAAELGGVKPADESSRRLWCTVGPGARIAVRVVPPTPGDGAFPRAAAAVLRDGGVDVAGGPDGVVVTFRPAAVHT